MRAGDTALYTLPRVQGGQQVKVNIVDSSKNGSCLIRLELIRNKPDFRWVGESDLSPIPPTPHSPVHQEFT